MDEDLGNPFKEARRTPLTRRIIEFAGPEYKMPANIKLYDGTTDPEDDLSRFASAANSREWPMPVWYSLRRACFKEPHEITKIVRKANESLRAFKERWTVETGFIMGVPDVMKISSFMDTVKSPELAKRFSNKVPTTVNEMMKRLDDFVRSEEAYARTELPKREVGETHRKTSLVFNRRDNWSSRNTHLRESRRSACRNSYRSGSDAYLANRTKDDRASYPLRGESLETPPDNATLIKKKGHYTNDCIQLRKQLEMALESGKLNHLVKYVRQRRKGSHSKEAPQTTKVINVISVNSVKEKKGKGGDEGAVDEYPNILYSNILERRFRGTFDCRSRSERVLGQKGRSGLKTLRAIPFTIHSMMKFPTPKGVATLVTQTVIIAKCRRLEKKQMIEESFKGEKEVAATEEVLVNPSFPDQRVTIGRRLGHIPKVVDSTLQSQIGRNLKAYVDDMVVKSKDEKMLLADIAETFDNLRKINMKLNPKKCSFEMVEGKFLAVPLEEDDTESWTLYTDGASSPKGSEAALLAGLRIARQMSISNIEVKVDSKLSESQINGNYEASKDSMIKYLAKAREYASTFKSFSIKNILKNMNQKADVLSKLASVAFNNFTKEVLVKVLHERSMKSQEVHTVVEEEGDNWITLILRCLEEGKGYLVPMLRCVDPLQANYVIREIHMGSCGMHVNPRAVVRKVVRQGYYWPTMHEYAKKKVEKCDSCQIHAPVPRLPKTLMTSIMAPWPFYQWGMDILGLLPPVRGGVKFVIMVIDYFTKWIEAKPLVRITRKEERRETASIREAKYKMKMEQYYNKKVRPSGFRPGEFMFRKNKASRVEDHGKLGLKWEGPYTVAEAYENGSYKLETLEDKEVPRTWHAVNLRKCYM
nr:hypothetical protein [Tanacetum cinerariifolium]